MKVKSQITIKLVEVVEQIIRSVFYDHVVAGVIVTSLMLRTLKLDHVIISIAKHIC